MFKKSPLIFVSCQGLYSVLSACQYPQLDRLSPGSLDWLYEVSFIVAPPPLSRDLFRYCGREYRIL
jgi:hypothetical protein